MASPPCSTTQSVSVEIRPMRAGDLPAVARLHRQSFPANPAARFGHAFVTRYLRRFVEDVWARSVVAVEDEKVVGYLVGITRVESQQPRRLSEKARLLLIGLPRIPLNLAFVARVVLRRVGRRLVPPVARHPREQGPIAVLSHVAVAPGSRAEGTGAELVQRFITDAAVAGARVIHLVTEHSPEGAGTFYTSLGWQTVRTQSTADGRTLCLYRLPLEDVAR
ncbi:GNAT family N-acetyltransferase [Aeromicrobium sp. CF4.19]|uniref:GNAT family N-acetyltransferase n=1 Tax=Aeromicrobium sp. CF4.19 TaxID=3373082 RepID=UPI003EE5C072